MPMNKYRCTQLRPHVYARKYQYVIETVPNATKNRRRRDEKNQHQIKRKPSEEMRRKPTKRTANTRSAQHLLSLMFRSQSKKSRTIVFSFHLSEAIFHFNLQYATFSASNSFVVRLHYSAVLVDHTHDTKSIQMDSLCSKQCTILRT